MALTTLKVPVELRDRISGSARERGVTVADYLRQVLDEHERRARLQSMARAMRARPPGEDYWSEFADLDAIGGGLADG